MPTPQNGTSQTLDLPKTETEQLAALQTQLTRMRRQLEAIYGEERIWSWLEEDRALPAATVTTAQSVIFEARVEDISTKRSKDGARTKVVLVASRRGTPVDDLCNLSEEDKMLVTISPRVIQQSLLEYAANQTYSDTPAAGFEVAPFEPDVPDETLEMRLLALGRPSLPDGWKQWPRDKKDRVAQWAWAITLNEENSNVDIPEISPDVADWFVPPSNGGAAAADNWVDAPPPKVSPEDAEKLAAVSAEQAQPPVTKPKGKVKKSDDAAAG